MAACRAYENFVRDVFLLYCIDTPTLTGKAPRSYLRARDFVHAEIMIQSAMPFLDWSSVEAVIERAEIYLRNGFLFKQVLSANLVRATELRRLRNHIAHNSKESRTQYIKVLQGTLPTLPLSIPKPGEFLLMPDRRTNGLQFLETYLSYLDTLAVGLTG